MLISGMILNVYLLGCPRMQLPSPLPPRCVFAWIGPSLGRPLPPVKLALCPWPQDGVAVIPALWLGLADSGPSPTLQYGARAGPLSASCRSCFRGLSINVIQDIYKPFSQNILGRKEKRAVCGQRCSESFIASVAIPTLRGCATSIFRDCGL